MKIIEIKALENGSHRNQIGNFNVIPDGWAVVPDDMETPNFPFGEFEVADENVVVVEQDVQIEVIDGEVVKTINKVEKVIGTRKVITNWYAGTIPEAEDAEMPVSEEEQLRADVDYIAVMTGVEL
ncbi:MAG: hypothetical protein IJ300_01545 [Clostridia bacterium]|nr:hypothetical protein [Clostridia bacterium]MBQ8765972.1 hypothetical protein [Clostridia bacterium]